MAFNPFEPATSHTGTDELFPDFMQGDVQNLMTGIADLQTPQYYQGQLVADQNPWLRNSLQNMYQFGAPGGAGGQMAGTMQGYGDKALQQGMWGGIDYLGDMRERGPNEFQYDQNLYDQTMANSMGGYQGMFDHGAQQIQQGFDWNQLPGLNMQNAMMGGGGNTKFGQQGALGQAMANQNIAGFGADLWGQANQMANTNAFGAGTQNLGSANLFDQSMMNNYGRMAQMGGNMLSDAYDMGTGNIGMQNQAGQQQNQYAQSLIDAQMDKWNFNQQAPWADLQMRNQLAQSWMNPGAIQYGNSPFQNILAGAQTALGGYQAGQDAGWWGNGTPNPNQAAANAAFGPISYG